MRLLTLAAALLLSLALPQGCSTADRGEESAASSTPSTAQSAGSESAPAPQPEPEPEPELTPETDAALHDAILLGYGGTYNQTNDGRMKTTVVSLFYADEWRSPEELPPGSYFSWFMTTTWEEDLSDEEREALYTLPDREGWAFPQDLYEARIQSRFAVSAEHLRSDELLYHPELGVYWLGAGGGVGMRPYVELVGTSWDGELLVLSVELAYDEEYMENESWSLTVRPEAGGGWKYESWVRLD